MKYQNKAIELISQKEIFGQKVCWIRILEDNNFLEVPFEALEKEDSDYSLELIRFISLAVKIKDEIAKKNILAPYESSLIPLPHQILVLEKVMQSQQNRFLLADEVGMGKTIETGLIMKELKLRGDIRRTLVIVPKSAMLQWQSELKEHFNEVFHVYDSELISSLAKTFARINADEEFNFWTQHNQIIVSTDALKPMERRQGWSKEKIDEYNKFRMEAVLNANFDLVVIDEVHKMGGASPTVSRYQLAQALCNAVPNVLLLSATPHRGKSDHFRRVLQLLDPDAFAGEGLPEIAELEPYVIRTEKRLAVDYEGEKLFNERQTYRMDVHLDSITHANQIALYEAVTEYVRKTFNAAIRAQNTAVGLIMILFQRLASSSTEAILSAMKGRLERLLAGENDEVDAYLEDEMLTPQEEWDLNTERLFTNFTGSVEDEVALLTELVQQAEDCLQFETDAKAVKLMEKFDQLKLEYDNPDIKILVFTEFRTTQRMLKRLLENNGYSCEVIHGGQDLDERKTALKRFKEESQILVGTDAAGESLNMQFCHIIFNYDLPWNPMMIEQRIGRVDRIGQQNKVIAFNMLTNNSVDRRVYQVIEEKLSAILQQLGIDKTSDVLDSTMDLKQVNKLYLQSLLDPTKFEFAGNQWLNEIKTKLKDFQATEGLLPQIKEEEIDKGKAAEVKYSPLPVWLADLITQFVHIENGSVQTTVQGYLDIKLGGQKITASFEPVAAINDPGVEHFTLQHDFVRRLLDTLEEYNSDQGIPKLRSSNGEETSGLWSLWQVSAQNSIEKKVSYVAQFVSDQGKIFPAYANSIWNHLVSQKDYFSFVGMIENNQILDLAQTEKESLEPQLFNSFKNLELELDKLMQIRLANKMKSFDFQVSRIKRIGIENIRESKLKRIEQNHQNWLNTFHKSKKVIPGIKHLISVYIDG